MKVITRADLGITEAPQIQDQDSFIKRALSAKYDCEVAIDTVRYAHTPVHRTEISWEDIVHCAGWELTRGEWLNLGGDPNADNDCIEDFPVEYVEFDLEDQE